MSRLALKSKMQAMKKLLPSLMKSSPGQMGAKSSERRSPPSIPSSVPYSPPGPYQAPGEYYQPPPPQERQRRAWPGMNGKYFRSTPKSVVKWKCVSPVVEIFCLGVANRGLVRWTAGRRNISRGAEKIRQALYWLEKPMKQKHRLYLPTRVQPPILLLEDNNNNPHPLVLVPALPLPPIQELPMVELSGRPGWTSTKTLRLRSPREDLRRGQDRTLKHHQDHQGAQGLGEQCLLHLPLHRHHLLSLGRALPRDLLFLEAVSAALRDRLLRPTLGQEYRQRRQRRRQQRLQSTRAGVEGAGARIVEEEDLRDQTETLVVVPEVLIRGGGGGSSWDQVPLHP